MNPDEPDEIESFSDEERALSADYGTRLDRLDEPLILYPPRSGAIDALHGRFFKYIVPISVLFYVVILAMALTTAISPFIPSASQQALSTELWWLLILYTLSLPLMYIFVRRKLSRAVLPVLAMRQDGIEIHSLNLDIFIPWEEIKEVRTFTFIEPHLGIVPFDLKKTLARGSRYTQIFCWMNEFCARLYKSSGISVTAIFLLDCELPLSIDVVAEQIISRQAHALKLIKPEDRP
ncbi:MAG: hypothetical protein Q8T09_16295 [Candidatus Melainabacteria bacterium]|nr:hypothetical protein [Candidatus Melainabacteria bacterium]